MPEAIRLKDDIAQIESAVRAECTRKLNGLEGSFAQDESGGGKPDPAALQLAEHYIAYRFGAITKNEVLARYKKTLPENNQYGEPNRKLAMIVENVVDSVIRQKIPGLREAPGPWPSF